MALGRLRRGQTAGAVTPKTWKVTSAGLDLQPFACQYMRIPYALRTNMDNTARKQATNLSIRSDLLSADNLSQTLEKILKAQDRQTWVKENRRAMETANQFVAEHGLWSDGLRIY